MREIVIEQERKPPYRKGFKLSEDHKRKINRRGWKPSKEIKRKISLSLGGTGTPIRPRKRYYHTRDERYMRWRSKVFERNNWVCQTCDKRSQVGERIYLEPHHIKGWTKYPKLRYEVENGITLCLECHRLTRQRH